MISYILADVALSIDQREGVTNEFKKTKENRKYFYKYTNNINDINVHIIYYRSNRLIKT